MEVVRLSPLHTGCLYSPGKMPGTHLLETASTTVQPEGQVNETQTRDLPACCAMPQSTVPPLAPRFTQIQKNNVNDFNQLF